MPLHTLTLHTSHYIYLLPALLLAACSEEPLLDEAVAATDRDALIEQGRYLTARNAEAPTAETSGTVDKSTWFPKGTLYRLLAYTKPYIEGSNDATKATECRFNKVAWEGEINGLHYINVTETPDRWFGFAPTDNEDADNSGTLRSIDFYGFTYGKVAERTESYIELDGVTGETTPTADLTQIKRTETVDADGNLPDLMRGELLNQTIQTAGRDAAANAQSVLPFRHSFSCLRFMAVQQYKEGTDTIPQFGDGLEIVSLKVTNTYNSASVYLESGLVEVAEKDKGDRELKFSLTDANDDGEREPLTGNFAVTTVQREFGEMILPPTFGDNLKNSDLSDGYAIGVELKVKCPSAEVREKFINADPTIEKSEDADGNCYMTVKKTSLPNNITNGTLYLKQNTGYTIVFSFQHNTVRIITVIPIIEEWLQGEDSTDYPGWDDQPIGQPQMFDDLVWSDRNLGAAHFDPFNAEFEYSMGYFYQAGRNIPYYPFKKDAYNNGEFPKISNLNGKQDYENNITAWSNSAYNFFPVVDERLLISQSLGEDSCIYKWRWSITANAQMSIPEEKPSGKSFGFVRENKLADTDNMYWDKSYIYQPISGAWRVPTSAQFMSIFPTTPYAGNITFKNGGGYDTPMNWGTNEGMMGNDVKTLRVTVPYYVDGSNEPPANKTAYTNNYDDYVKAWNTLKSHNDVGTTKDWLYEVGYGGAGGPQHKLHLDPDGDPEGGYASIYVLSREDDSIERLPSKYHDGTFFTKEWGTIYGIKRVYTKEAYRMRWRALVAQDTGSKSPGIVIEVCRYRCSSTDTFDEETYKNYDWDHPVARLYFPVGGLGDHTGEYINFGTECMYATSDPISNGTTSALQIKITGNNSVNCYIAVVKGHINRHFGMQIRPIWGG